MMFRDSGVRLDARICRGLLHPKCILGDVADERLVLM
jgi:hypothetical protein